MSLSLHQIASTYANQLTASECSQPFMPECDVYKVMDKIYLMTFTLNGIRVINLKVDPTHGEMLCDIYPFIRTGYHMNKRHWISVYDHDEIDHELIEDLIQSSYELVVTKLKKVDRQRIEILKSVSADCSKN